MDILKGGIQKQKSVNYITKNFRQVHVFFFLLSIQQKNDELIKVSRVVMVCEYVYSYYLQEVNESVNLHL